MNQNDLSLRQPPRLYTPSEAAKILRISRSKTYALIGSGLISTVTVGLRGLRIPSSEIDRITTEGTGSGLAR